MSLSHDAIVGGIRELLPNAEFYFTGTDLNNLRWLCDLPRPSDEEIIAAAEKWQPPKLTTIEKLNRAGISVEELKEVLGL